LLRDPSSFFVWYVFFVRCVAVDVSGSPKQSFDGYVVAERLECDLRDGIRCDGSSGVAVPSRVPSTNSPSHSSLGAQGDPARRPTRPGRAVQAGRKSSAPSRRQRCPRDPRCSRIEASTASNRQAFAESGSAARHREARASVTPNSRCRGRTHRSEQGLSLICASLGMQARVTTLTKRRGLQRSRQSTTQLCYTCRIKAAHGVEGFDK
jgi:hypothetical protein